MASFEEQLAELEKVVETLERGDLSLEENVSLFERGMQLSDACKTQLATAESRIRVLLEPEKNGPIRVEDLAFAGAVGEGEEDRPGDEEGDDHESG